jgi:hypothetical protein
MEHQSAQAFVLAEGAESRLLLESKQGTPHAKRPAVSSPASGSLMKPHSPRQIPIADALVVEALTVHPEQRMVFSHVWGTACCAATFSTSHLCCAAAFPTSHRPAGG